MTRNRTSSLHLKPAPGSSPSSPESSDSALETVDAGISSSTSSPKVTPWNWFRTSASTSPSPLISNETSRRSPFSTTGIDQTFCEPFSASVVSRETSSLSFLPSPRTVQSFNSKLEGSMSLMHTSCNAVSPLFSKIIRTS